MTGVSSLSLAHLEGRPVAVAARRHYRPAANNLSCNQGVMAYHSAADKADYFAIAFYRKGIISGGEGW